MHWAIGANDQATAEYASRALGKRTIRYQSESRTIELMGLPRRTKVEQIRERDLMMPQEVGQMPENKMILLIEGQRGQHSASAGSRLPVTEARAGNNSGICQGGRSFGRNSLAGASEGGEAFDGRRGGGSSGQGGTCGSRGSCSTPQTHRQ